MTVFAAPMYLVAADEIFFSDFQSRKTTKNNANRTRIENDLKKKGEKVMHLYLCVPFTFFTLGTLYWHFVFVIYAYHSHGSKRNDD